MRNAIQVIVFVLAIYCSMGDLHRALRSEKVPWYGLLMTATFWGIWYAIPMMP